MLTCPNKKAMQWLLTLSTRTPCPHWFFSFLLLSWLHMLWLTSGFLALAAPQLPWNSTTLFNLCAWWFYSLFYLLPVAGLGWLSLVASHSHHPVRVWTVYAGSVLVLLLLRVDLLIYELYSFHFNSFVWNLILTPGGVGSLGSSTATELSAVLLVLQTAVLQGATLFISRKGLLLCWRQVRHWRWLSAIACSLFLVQGTVYGLSDIQHFGPVLDGSKAYPLFQRVRFRSLATSLGLEVNASNTQQLQLSQAALRYPLNPVSYQSVAAPPNIIFLVAESLRWDQLSPELMPNTWQFGLENSRFANHYSSGNGTREALFGIFYGLYGSYWEKFMHARQSPLLMDRIQQLGYQLDIRTSAVFTYPEFNKTLFVKVPASAISESGDSLPPWQRDQDNTDALLRFLKQRDVSRPFMSFFFLESTHASYSFPSKHALYSDYQEEVDYMHLLHGGLQREGGTVDVTPLLNRYHNAAHWIDVQLGRIYAELAHQGLLNSTIVIVTGDHGEEFMEKGAWGHNSSFVEEQTHVPLVVHLPNQGAQVIASTTSHLDIGTTLLQTLGIDAPLSDYSLGRNLFDSSPRSHWVLSDWHSISVQTPALKYRIPYLQQSVDHWAPTDSNDQPLSATRADSLILQTQPLILETMRQFSVFTQPASPPSNP
jgi:uncharacterized protein